MEPAQSIIRKLGGAPEVARIAGVHRTRVYSWTWPKSAGGTGGTVPFNHVPALIDAATAKGIPLSAADFLPSPSQQGEVA